MNRFTTSWFMSRTLDSKSQFDNSTLRQFDSSTIRQFNNSSFQQFIISTVRQFDPPTATPVPQTPLQAPPRRTGMYRFTTSWFFVSNAGF
jgi:hypothetical protein